MSNVNRNLLLVRIYLHFSYLLRTTGLSQGLTFSAISSQREKGEMETRAAVAAGVEVPDDGDPPGCRGRSNMHRWYLDQRHIFHNQ